MDPASILRLENPGLAPLAPLMHSDDPERVVVESKRRILAASAQRLSRRRKADLCGILAFLAGMVIEDPGLIYRLVWEDWMGLERSVIAQDWIRKGMEKGIVKGKVEGFLEARQRDIIAVISSRFGKVRRKIEARILRISDADLLQRLLTRAAVAKDIEEFSKHLPE